MTQENLLARYSILNELGQGTTGRVYAARDRQTGAVVALKRLDPALFSQSDASFVEHILRQARGARLLIHRNIVRVHEAGSAAGTVYVAMELVEGESLRKVLDQGLLPVARAIEIIRDVASGLAHAHLQGVVHGGLKPSKVLVLRSGMAKIAGFGIGQAMAPSETPSGRPGYRSPEQVRGEPIDHRSDIYSLGALFYEMLAHRPPFESAKDFPHGAPPAPSDVNPHVPRVLDAVVLSMLAAQPAARMPGVPILLRDLQRLEEGLGLGSGAKAAAGEPAASPPPSEPERASVMPGVKRMRDREPPREPPLADPATDREAFDYQKAIAMMDRESRRERSSPGSRRGMFTVLAFMTAVLGVGGAGYIYQSSRAGDPDFVARHIPDAPVTTPEIPRPTAPVRVAEARKKAAATVVTSEPAPPPAPAAAPAPAAPAPIAKAAVTPAPVADATEKPAPVAAAMEKPAPMAEVTENATPVPEAPPPSALPEPPAAAPAPLPPTQPPVARAATPPAPAPAPDTAAQAQKLPRAKATANVREPPGGTARLILAISPRGELYIDGKHHGTTPPMTTFDLEPGMHRIEVRSGSRTPYLTYMTVQAGDVRRIQYDFDTSRAVHPPRTASSRNIERAAR